MTGFEAATRTRAVGEYQFLSNRFGDWTVAKSVPSSLGAGEPEQYRIRLEKRLGHLRGGPIEFNIEVPEWNPDNLALIRRFLDLARLTTGKEIHLEWEIEDRAQLQSAVQYSEMAREHFSTWGKPVTQCLLSPLSIVKFLPDQENLALSIFGSPDEWIERVESGELTFSSTNLLPIVEISSKPIPIELLASLASLGVDTYRLIPSSIHQVLPTHHESLPPNLTRFIEQSSGEGGLRELSTAEILCRVLNGREPKRALFSSPAKGCLRTLALNRVGEVFSSRSGRRLSQTMESEEFFLGHISSLSYHDAVTHPVGRAILLASIWKPSRVGIRMPTPLL